MVRGGKALADGGGDGGGGVLRGRARRAACRCWDARVTPYRGGRWRRRGSRSHCAAGRRACRARGCGSAPGGLVSQYPVKAKCLRSVGERRRRRDSRSRRSRDRLWRGVVAVWEVLARAGGGGEQERARMRRRKGEAPITEPAGMEIPDCAYKGTPRLWASGCATFFKP